MAAEGRGWDSLLESIREVLDLLGRTSDETTKRILRERLRGIFDEAEDPETTRLLYKEWMGIETIVLSDADVGAFREMQLMYRPEWELTFAIDNRGSFPQVRWGRTPNEERMYMQGSEMFDRIARRAREIRQSTGRFFISHNGVFFKDNEKYAQKHQIIRFEFE